MINSRLDQVKQGYVLSEEDMVAILNSTGAVEDQLFSLARSVRKEVFNDRIFLYGFVYFSTWCQNDCNFCYYRRSNQIERYRKNPTEILEIADSLEKSGVHLLDLTMGEDPYYRKNEHLELLDLMKQIKHSTKLPIMISPGLVENQVIDSFAKQGVEWYALYQETHNRELFQGLRVKQDYDRRMAAKAYARRRGMLVEEGILTGIGETYVDLATSIVQMGEVGASQMRVMSFVPQKGIPLEHVKTPDRMLERKLIALMRIRYPYALIPASLDVDGIMGLRDRLDAGANVVTSIIPPLSGLAGVAQTSMDIDEGSRTVEGVSKVLESMGLRPATALQYQDYLRSL